MAKRLAGANVSTSKINPLANDKGKVTLIFGGKTGAGKSTLITKLLKVKTVSRGDVSELEYPKESDPTPDPTTAECYAYYLKKNEAILEVVDTVGLISGEDMSKKLKEIATYTDCTADLLVYCLHVGPGQKFVDGNPAMMKAWQKEFGKEIWKHCVLVFTFSNIMWEQISKKKDEDLAVMTYLNYIKNYAVCFERQLKSMGVQDITVRTIFDNPVRVKGHHTIIGVPAGQEFTDEVLPNIPQDENDRWMGILLQEMIESCRQEKKALFKRYRQGMSWPKAAFGAAAAAGAAAVAVGAIVIALVRL